MTEKAPFFLPVPIPLAGDLKAATLLRLHGLDPEASASIQAGLAGLSLNGQPLCSLISRKVQAALVIQEMENDESDFVEGGVDQGTLLGNWLSSSLQAGTAVRLACEFGLKDRLGQGIRFLSTGELRKAMIALHLADQTPVFVGEDLYEGLDRPSRPVLDASLAREGGRIEAFVLLGNEADGNPEKPALEEIARKRQWDFIETRVQDHPGFSASLHSPDMAELEGIYAGSPRLDIPATDSPDKNGLDSGVLVRMCRVNVAWDGMPVLSDFDWELRAGEHTFIQGPNGCGKTSLLRLITGENPQVYSNHVELFGMRRGSGETVWDIRRHLGLVSHRFHMDCLWHADYSCLELVVSGFHDSIGLYERPGETEVASARKWLEILGMKELAPQAFKDLDWGRQRMLLVARALVKQPRLLILDEPCQGLEPRDRQVFLTLLESIAGLHSSTVLHVSHDPSERLGFYRCLLESKGKGQAWIRTELG